MLDSVQLTWLTAGLQARGWTVCGVFHRAVVPDAIIPIQFDMLLLEADQITVCWIEKDILPKEMDLRAVVSCGAATPHCGLPDVWVLKLSATNLEPACPRWPKFTSQTSSRLHNLFYLLLDSCIAIPIE